MYNDTQSINSSSTVRAGDYPILNAIHEIGQCEIIGMAGVKKLNSDCNRVDIWAGFVDCLKIFNEELTIVCDEVIKQPILKDSLKLILNDSTFGFLQYFNKHTIQVPSTAHASNEVKNYRIDAMKYLDNLDILSKKLKDLGI